jgi:hypothetical protein
MHDSLFGFRHQLSRSSFALPSLFGESSAFAAASVIPFVFGEGRPASQPKFVAQAKLITLGFRPSWLGAYTRSSLVVDHAVVAATIVRERGDSGRWPLTVQIVGWGVVWGTPWYGLSLVEGPRPD